MHRPHKAKLYVGQGLAPADIGCGILYIQRHMRGGFVFCSEKNIKTVVLLAFLTFKMASDRMLYVYLYSYEAFLALYVEIHSTIISTDNIPD